MTRSFVNFRFSFGLEYAIKKVQSRELLKTKFKWDMLDPG